MIGRSSCSAVARAAAVLATMILAGCAITGSAAPSSADATGINSNASPGSHAP